jgi:hypothetical protein
MRDVFGHISLYMCRAEENVCMGGEWTRMLARKIDRGYKRPQASDATPALLVRFSIDKSELLSGILGQRYDLLYRG